VLLLRIFTKWQHALINFGKPVVVIDSTGLHETPDGSQERVNNPFFVTESDFTFLFSKVILFLFRTLAGAYSYIHVRFVWKKLSLFIYKLF